MGNGFQMSKIRRGQRLWPPASSFWAGQTERSRIQPPHLWRREKDQAPRAFAWRCWPVSPGRRTPGCTPHWPGGRAIPRTSK